MVTSPRAIIGKFSRLQPSPRWSFADVQRAKTNALTHSYHRYPAKFIPQLVNKAVLAFTKGGDVVCDPFGGCGTTLVESKLLGRESIGFDINPVAKLITDTKTKAIKPERIAAAREKFLAAYDRIGKTGTRKFYHSERIYYWFTGSMVRRLDRVYAAIFAIKEKDVRRFFLCAFSHILKNCSRWLMKSIKPTINPTKEFPNPKKIFLSHLDSMIKKNDEYYIALKKLGSLNTKAKMQLHDSTKSLPLKDGAVDLIVTSPPYVTSYEYADLHQLSLLWFGDDKRNFKGWDSFSEGFNHFRKKFVGSSFKTTDHKEFGSSIAEDIVKKMESKDKSMARSIARYFLDMHSAFQEMHRILERKGKAVIIIGNTELHGVPILNAEVAAEQLGRIGFQSTKLIKREVSNKMITPWRDDRTGKFTSKTNPDKKRAYEYEYVLIMEKIQVG